MNTQHTLQHIAFIMDGNRRWAVAHGKPKTAGHSAGVEAMETIVEAVIQKNISHMTVYARSTENLKRPALELNVLYALIDSLPTRLARMMDEGVRIRIIGNRSLLPTKTQRTLQDLEKQTKDNTTLTLTLAIGYGGKDEIVRGVNAAIAAGVPVTEASFELLLDTAVTPPVDLIVRTGGHQRLSNFLPWSGAYAELYFTDTLWPAFDETELDAALTWFDAQKRNNGK